jgi:hypothetical protein
MPIVDERLQRLRELEPVSRLLEPDAAQRQRLLEAVNDYAAAFLAGVAAGPACRLHAPIPTSALPPAPDESGREIGAVLRFLADHVDAVGVNPTSGRFLGYIPGGGLFASALGDFLAAVTNRYSGHFSTSPGAARLENRLVRWMADLVGFPDSALGVLTSGGSLANLTALVTTEA